MNRLCHTVLILIALNLLPIRSSGLEVIEADPDLSARMAGDSNVDVKFGTAYYHGLHTGTYMLGTFYAPESREISTVLGFRLTEAFLQEWENQGEAQFLFSIMVFESGDPHKICPIHIELLERGHENAMTAACRSAQPRPRLGSIHSEELQEDHLYSFPISFLTGFEANDILWIGLDCTNPLDPDDHILILSGDMHQRPGGAPPLLIAGSPDATTHTVHGMSFLQSLNRRFSTAENIQATDPPVPAPPRWINPFRTAQKLKTLEEFKFALQQQLAHLPEYPPLAPVLYQGFHSSIKPAHETWTLQFPLNNRDSSMALFPAVHWNGNAPEVYAFPKRFIIRAFPSGNHEPITVADWSRADFPINSPIPIIFTFPWQNYARVEVQVLKGIPMPDGHAFALSEVSFAQIDDSQPIHLITEPESSLEAPPHWSAAYATDGLIPFSLPRAVDHTLADFRLLLQKSDTPTLILRQAKPATWQSFEFYPTAYAEGAPPRGFPQGFKIDFSDENDFSTLIESISTSEPIVVHTADRPYVFRFPTVKARCVRITFDPAITEQNERVLQLEEITVNGGFPLTHRRKATFQLEGVTQPADPTALYDRIVSGHQLHIPLRRTINLIRRSVLSEEQKNIQRTISALEEAHKRTITALEAGASMLAILLFGGILFIQRKLARKAQQHIRLRIQQDLHDEIGSQLSAISLIADMDKDAPELAPQLRTDLTDINQSAREAIASLTEVIWLTDKEVLTFSQCLEVMQQRAIQMVHTIKLELDFPQQVPDHPFSYKNKRNLILLFTEAINNAIKHSDADTIRAGVLLNDRTLTLYVSDNGRGFAVETTGGSIGLKSMNDRARALGGILEINSSPEKGTTIRYTGKLKPI